MITFILLFFAVILSIVFSTVAYSARSSKRAFRARHTRPSAEISTPTR